MKKILSGEKKSEVELQEKKMPELERVFKAKVKELKTRIGDSCSDSYRKLASGLRKESKLIDSIAVYLVPTLCLPLF